MPGPQLSILQCQGDCSTSCGTQEPSHESFCSLEWLSNLSIYWNHLEPLCSSDSWASPMEILIRKLNWWVWRPERASLLARCGGMLLIQGPHSELSCCTIRGVVHQSSEKNALYTSPSKIIFKFCVYLDLCAGYRCTWSSKDGVEIYAAGATLGTELWSLVYALNCGAIAPVLLLFLSRESGFPGVILQIPTF